MPVKLKRRDLAKVGITLPGSVKPPRPKNDPRLFVECCLAAGLPAPLVEFKFHPIRKWRFDFAWPHSGLFQLGSRGGVALEIQGGLWQAGRHNRAAGYLKDMEKFNEAQLMDWIVLLTDWKSVDSGEAFVLVKRAMGLA